MKISFNAALLNGLKLSVYLQFRSLVSDKLYSLIEKAYLRKTHCYFNTLLITIGIVYQVVSSCVVFYRREGDDSWRTDQFETTTGVHFASLPESLIEVSLNGRANTKLVMTSPVDRFRDYPIFSTLEEYLTLNEKSCFEFQYNCSASN